MDSDTASIFIAQVFILSVQFLKDGLAPDAACAKAIQELKNRTKDVNRNPSKPGPSGGEHVPMVCSADFAVLLTHFLFRKVIPPKLSAAKVEFKKSGQK